MRLERIIEAAVNDMKAGRAEPHCGRPSSYGMDELTWAEGYAEPGYDEPKKGVLLGNWNGFPKRLVDVLERAGYSIEWSDEWSTCDDCGKAVRTSADSWGWQRSYELLNDCEIVCHECIDWPDFLQTCEDRDDIAVTRSVNPAEHGYERLSQAGEYESGWHPGQNDNPKAILENLHLAGRTGILFRVSDSRQFDVSFETWIRMVADDEGAE